ncbi:MarR family winged helix-turn-helix transcriptional regulator [Saccharopolyspora spinosa]|uniref:DNA-binding MarR family transcriptional regulator n=1 Tax=Saccharopolyspora spinosa TaxID=60894 RepID=A0A2N3XPS2_SACSN|nr:MarR family transcriptional regulator [Saccharopolyspora spinosa]PKW12677.1 DNA-binding MarR family transcriptional regulator [Saccharopolyspora spinosa]
MSDEPVVPFALLGKLWDVALLLADDVERGLTERGLSRARANLLWQLYQRGPSTQREISRALGVTPRNVTGLLDALEDGGYVARRAHPTDRRAMLVDLTEEGRAALTKMHHRADQAAVDLFGDVPATELATFHRLLDHIGDRLRAQAETTGDGT